MLLTQLEAFVEVARQGSVSRAAESLFLSQPALTQRIQGLERELGTRLFVRSAQGVRLTESGQGFLTYAERTLDTLSEGQKAVAAGKTTRHSELVIAATAAVSSYVLPSILSTFELSHAHVRLTVRTESSDNIVRMVLEGDAHLGVVRALRHPELEIVPFYEDKLLLVVSATHALGSRVDLRMQDLESERLLVPACCIKHDEAAWLPLAAAIELDDLEAEKRMTVQGLGVALLPRIAVAEELTTGLLRELAIAGIPQAHRRLAVIRRRDQPRESIASAFVAALVANRPDQRVGRSVSTRPYGAVATA